MEVRRVAGRQRHLIVVVALLLVACGGPGLEGGPGAAPRFDFERLPTATPVLVQSGASPQAMVPPTATREPVQRHLQGVTVRIVAGSGARGALDGPGAEARFDGPFSLARDGRGYLVVAERPSGRMRIVDDEGFVRTWIGTPSQEASWGRDASSPFQQPSGLATDAEGTLYVVDASNRLMAVHVSGTFQPIAGGDLGYRDGRGAEAAFAMPWDVTLLPGGDLVVSDALNHRLRHVTPAGQVSTLAGAGEPGLLDGAALEARFYHPNGLAVDDTGTVYIADGGSLNTVRDEGNACVRRLSPDGRVSTYAGTAEAGYTDGTAAEARFGRPLLGMDLDDAGNLYVADMSNHVVRMITPAGEVVTVAGSGEFGLREGSGEEAQLGLPADILWDGQGGLYVADYGQHVVWHVDLPD